MSIQVEWLDEAKIGRNVYAKGDRTTLDDEAANEFVRLGWAKNVETGEQNEPVPGAQKLQVDDAVIKAF